jgi:hypothetical protein
MERKSPKLLQDIRDAAAFIRQATADKTLDDYRSDRLLRQAIERNFEIIGEAVGRLAIVTMGILALTRFGGIYERSRRNLAGVTICVRPTSRNVTRWRRSLVTR